MAGYHRGAPQSMRFRLEFLAFCEANRDVYLRYAQVRIEDQAEARRCVDAVLEAVELRWVAVLGSESPAARVWRFLRAEAGSFRSLPVKSEGQLHAVLREDQADIMLLHHQLQLSLNHAAGLMGLPDPDARALLRGAERDFGSRAEH